MKYSLLKLLLILPIGIYAQTPNQNYIKTVQPKVPVSAVNFNNGIFPVSPETSLISIDYQDGLGRTIQSNLQGAGSAGEDIINVYDYDQFGRTAKEYLPFTVNVNNGNFRADAELLQKNYYSSRFGDNTAYSETRYDQSPMNRPEEISGGGDIWKIITDSDLDRTKKFVYSTNAVNELRLNVINETTILNNAGFYPANSLLKTTVRNENWIASDLSLNSTQTYKDKSGKKVAEINFLNSGGITEKIITQYVYDDKGLLRYILSPKAYPYDFQAFQPATGNLYWDYRKFISNGSVGGGGGVTANLTNGVLKITFSAGFSATSLKTGPIVFLDEKIPDYEFGNMNCTSCTDQYNLYIKDGYLCIRINTYPFSTTGFSATYTCNVGSVFSFQSNQDVLDKYAHQFIYDQYNRKVSQKAPGKEWENIIFDSLDRPILMQDALLKQQGLWIFTKYDAEGRILYTGLYSSTAERADLQAQADSYIVSNTLNLSNNEVRTVGRITLADSRIHYTNSAFPTTGIQKLLTINYYDSYDFIDLDSPSNPGTVLSQSVTSNTKGLLTAAYIRTLSETTSWSSHYFYYDDKERTIFSYEKNHLGGNTAVQTQFDFRGKVLRTITTHQRTASQVALTITDRYEYDHAERLIGHYNKINNQPEEVIAKYFFNELGEVIEKKVGGSFASDVELERIDYEFNVRGWLTNINKPNKYREKKLFSYEVNYTEDGAGTPGYYNGNIATISWSSLNYESLKKGYNYQYDKLNRLSNATYSGITNQIPSSYSFNEAAQYDNNGNIIAMQRSGRLSNGVADNALDILTYTYDGNQLLKVVDSGNVTQGFTDNSSSTNDYSYDINGNLIKDRNKNITNITYNILNRMESVTFSFANSLKFVYDATGKKLSKSYVPSFGNIETSDYLGDFQYQNGELQYFPTPEGYVLRTLNAGLEQYVYIYTYKDYLGNVRLSYSGQTTNLFTNTFTSGVEGFQADSGATVSNSNGRLQITGTSDNAGAKKLLISNAPANTKINIKGLLDLGNTATVRVIAVQTSASGLSTSTILAIPGNGNFNVNFVTSALYPNVSLRFEKLNLFTNSSTSFYIDNLVITRVDRQIVSETDYYPYGMVHGGEYISSAAGNYNYKYQDKEFQGESTFDMYDFGSRMYDAELGRWSSADPQNQYSSPYLAMGNNPVVGVDPNGEFVFTTLAAIFAPPLLPVAIGADIGMWMGGSMANGTMNPFKWDYSSGKTWTYMGAGAVSGALTGAISTSVATSGVVFANTKALIAGSMASGMLTNLYAGKDVEIYFGFGSYNFSNPSFNYIGKKGNSFMSNLGYGLGAIANFNDIMAGFSPSNIGDVDLVTEHSDSIGHSAIVDSGTTTNQSIISFGPPDHDFSLNPFKSVKGTNQWPNHLTDGSPVWRSKIIGINKAKLLQYGSNLNSNTPKYNVYTSSCVTHTSSGLIRSGFLNVGVHPFVLHLQAYLRETGLRTYFSHYLQKK